MSESLTRAEMSRASRLPMPRSWRHRWRMVSGGLLLVALLSLLLSATLAAHAQASQILAVLHTTSSVSGSASPTTPQATPSTPAPLTVRPLIRLGQDDPAQYANLQQYQRWWPSSCSAAAMAELINAYRGGSHLRIADVLAIEASFQNPQVITPEQGLLYAGGIARTLGHFGFATTMLAHPTLAQVISLARQGTPVLVNFPPDRWAGGHFLLVVGGSATTVSLVDSSRLNLRSLPASQFLRYWAGFAEVVTPTRYSVLGPPTVRASFISQVLTAYHSPAAGAAQALYDEGVQAGIDPAVALAFFFHESRFGTQGVARASLSLGNLRCIPTAQCVGGYAYFERWRDGFAAFYSLLAGPLYAGNGLVTIEQIIPRYAPAADHNDEHAYIAAVEHALDTWRAGTVLVA